MSDAAQEMWDRMVSDIGSEGKRLMTQGTMELASALFNGNAFVPYGPGQYTPSPEHHQEQEPVHEQPEQAQEHGTQEHEIGLER
jgi:hypothetical protein